MNDLGAVILSGQVVWGGAWDYAFLVVFAGESAAGAQMTTL